MQLPRRLSSFFAAFVAAAGLIAVAPATQADVLPVLWEGDVRTSAGQPTPAEVVAFIRPPALELVPGAPLVPLARTTTDATGHFTLRSLPSEAFRLAQDDAGWVTIMVAAFSADRVTMAVDSIAWNADAVRWITHPAELVEPSNPVTTATERPTVLVVPAAAPTAQGDPPRGFGSCWLKGSRDEGVHPVEVGELHLHMQWGGKFKYTNTRTSSFQVGVAEKGHGWEVGGSVSWSRERGLTHEKHPIPARDNIQMFSYDADMIFKRFDWGCNKGYPDVSEVSTLEPVDWTGGMHQRVGGPQPPCGNERYHSSVDPRTVVTRDEGSSMTLDGAISVLGFRGSMTSAISRSVVYTFDNTVWWERNLCGSSNYIVNETRVASLP